MTDQLNDQLAQNRYHVSTRQDRELLLGLHETVKLLAAAVDALETRLALLEPEPEQ